MKCKVENCDNEVYVGSKEYCQKHYMRLYRHGSTDVVKVGGKKKSEPKVCSICGDKHFGRGLCNKHYIEKYRHGGMPINGNINIKISEELECGILEIMKEKNIELQEACILLMETGIRALRGEK